MTTHYEPPHASELVAENVRALMARTKAKQADLANALGMTQGAVSKKVNGDRPFTLDEIDHVARLFGVPVGSLFEAAPVVVPFPRGLDQTRDTGTDTRQYHDNRRDYSLAA